MIYWIEDNVAVISVHGFLTGGFPASGSPRDVYCNHHIFSTIIELTIPCQSTP
ncbi:hypothetical protein DMR_32150 [Solidesulfovibrio magneticus RS-1]|uniref:Uncharacterized protein n=1 Tax=Solidesulfovibrio magneticus (strain ATCC 700980 / DSM 13731 / RS-1) TaxID=573370 RepID=C4XJF6_SOLM1|nr:hypothetical protein DMR_32150 [Solidesulfovibrio magneticus RS-1]